MSGGGISYLAMLALGASAWQLGAAWDLWRQRRLAVARADGQWQGRGRQPWLRSARQALRELSDGLAQGLQSWVPAGRAAAWNSRLLKHPDVDASLGGLMLRTAALGAFGCLGSALLGLGPASVFGLGLGLLPALKLRDAEHRRIAELRQALPDAVDLLTACVQAGLGLDQALIQAGGQLEPGPLRQEWMHTLDQMRTGAQRRQAFSDWEKRCQTEDLGPVLRAILRSEERGVPLSPVLHAASEQMRRMRSLRIQEQAAKAPIRMLVPLMLFFLPAVFLILFGPVFLKLSELGF